MEDCHDTAVETLVSVSSVVVFGKKPVGLPYGARVRFFRFCLVRFPTNQSPLVKMGSFRGFQRDVMCLLNILLFTINLETPEHPSGRLKGAGAPWAPFCEAPGLPEPRLIPQGEVFPWVCMRD